MIWKRVIFMKGSSGKKGKQKKKEKEECSCLISGCLRVNSSCSRWGWNSLKMRILCFWLLMVSQKLGLSCDCYLIIYVFHPLVVVIFLCCSLCSVANSSHCLARWLAAVLPWWCSLIWSSFALSCNAGCLPFREWQLFWLLIVVKRVPKATSSRRQVSRGFRGVSKEGFSLPSFLAISFLSLDSFMPLFFPLDFASFYFILFHSFSILFHFVFFVFSLFCRCYYSSSVFHRFIFLLALFGFILFVAFSFIPYYPTSSPLSLFFRTFFTTFILFSPSFPPWLAFF